MATCTRSVRLKKGPFVRVWRAYEELVPQADLIDAEVAEVVDHTAFDVPSFEEPCGRNVRNELHRVIGRLHRVRGAVDGPLLVSTDDLSVASA